IFSKMIVAFISPTNEIKPSKVSINDSQPFRNALTNINTFKAVKVTHIDVLSDKDEIMFDASLPSTHKDEISNISISADQNDYPRQIEDEMLTEEHVISDDDEVDEIMHNVSSLLNNEDNISNDLTNSIANDFQASTTPHGSTTSLLINNKISDNNDLTSQNMNATLTNVIEKLNLDGDNISKAKNDKANVLKNKLTNNSLRLCRDKHFLNSNSIESFLTTNFDVLFDKNDIVNISFKSLFKYSTSIENLEKYLKEWHSQFDYLSSLKHKVNAKRLKMLYDLKGAFFSCSMMKLLNLTRCSAITLVEAGIIAKFLMRSTVEQYDYFLKSLLNDNDASHQSSEFDSTIIQ
ncbi:13280_t:CDS:2, partial [Dentiscutata erythropus]